MEPKGKVIVLLFLVGFMLCIIFGCAAIFGRENLHDIRNDGLRVSAHSMSTKEQAQRILERDGFYHRVLISQWNRIQLQAKGKEYHAKPHTLFVAQEHLAITGELGTKVLFRIGCDSLFFLAYVTERDLLKTTIEQTIVQSTGENDFRHSAVELALGASLNVDFCQDSKCKIYVRPKGYH